MGKRRGNSAAVDRSLARSLARAFPRLLTLPLSLPLSLPLCLPAAMLLLAAPARAEWKFTPTVDLRGTYTDNVGLAPDDKKEARFVAEVTPGFTLLENTPRLKARASYQLHYYGYDDSGVEGARHVQQSLTSELSSILVDDLLFLDANAAIGSRPVSVFGPSANYSGYAGANTDTVKTWRISPYLRHSFGATASTLLRYTRDSVSSGNAGLGDSNGDTLLFQVNSGPLFRRVGWGAYASLQRLHDSIAENTTVKTAGVNLRYRISDSLALTSTAGYDQYDYETVGKPVEGKNWSLGFDWTPSQRSSVRANAGRRYYGNSYFLEALHRSRRSVWTLNYNDAVTTTRDRMLLPATVDTASVIDRLFAADIADPVARRQAVEAYIRAAGLPAALAESVNYFSNRYILQKSLQMSVALNSARTTAVLSAFKVDRLALSSFEADGSISGPSSGRSNDDTSQVGASALVSLRLTSRSSANLSLTSARSESNKTGLKSRNNALRATLTRQFSPRMSGSAELRHTAGNLYAGAADYSENAVSASLSLKF